MHKMNEEKIEEILKSLSQIQSSSESVARMHKNVKSQITKRCRGGQQPFRHKLVWLAPAMAASILIIGLVIILTQTPPSPGPDQIVSQGPAYISPTCLGSLNAAFESGGMESVEQLFDTVSRIPKNQTKIKSIHDVFNGDL